MDGACFNSITLTHGPRFYVQETEYTCLNAGKPVTQGSAITMPATAEYQAQITKSGLLFWS
jgi:hypothetical protein